MWVCKHPYFFLHLKYNYLRIRASEYFDIFVFTIRWCAHSVSHPHRTERGGFDYGCATHPRCTEWDGLAQSSVRARSGQGKLEKSGYII